MAEPDFLDEPPDATSVTDYDRRHLKLYARLLDAKAAGATWEEAFRVLFAPTLSAEPARARRIYDAHLKRAEWMSASGHEDLKPATRH